MKWVSRFLVIFTLVFALLTGIYIARTGMLPWFRDAAVPPLATKEVEVRGLPQAAEFQGSVLEALNRETVGLANKVLPSVVSITTTKVIREVKMTRRNILAILGVGRGEVENRLVEGFGSGVIVSEDGLVITNQHVIEGMHDIQLLLNDGRQFKAEVLASDAETDLAVLKVDAKGLAPLPLGNSDAVNVGEFVMAVGNPYGLHETVSLGNISAKGRVAATPDGPGEPDFLQTDAMINRGHSGGPLVNIRGELVGITRAIYTGRKDEGWQGIAFAIPANTVRQTLDRILQPAPTPEELRARPNLGVRFKSEVPASTRDILRLGDRRGLLLEDVEETSLARENGLRSNDFIYSANGVPTHSEAAFYAEVSKAMPQGRMELRLLRGGLPLSLPLILKTEDGEPDGRQKM